MPNNTNKKHYMVQYNCHVVAEGQYEAELAAKVQIDRDDVVPVVEELSPEECEGYVEDDDEDDQYENGLGPEYLDDSIPVVPDDVKPWFVDITVDMLKDDVKEDLINKVLTNYCKEGTNYDVLPLCWIPDMDPGGNYETFLLATIGDYELYYSDLKPEVLASLKKRKEDIS